MDTSDLGFFSKELAVAIGGYEAIVFNKFQWCIKSATRQVELGIPKEQALLNNLPTYAVACNEDLTPQIAATAEVEEMETLDPTDPYALTEGNLAARNKAFEVIKAVKAISVKLPERRTKREQILAANIADLADSTPFRKSVVVRVEPVVEDEDDSIPW